MYLTTPQTTKIGNDRGTTVAGVYIAPQLTGWPGLWKSTIQLFHQNLEEAINNASRISGKKMQQGV